MELSVFLAWQVAFLPVQMILWYGIYSERRRMQAMLRFAVIKLHQRR